MTNKKISDLNIATDGLTTDQLEVLRGGSNVRMTFEEFVKVLGDLTQLPSGIDFDNDELSIWDNDVSATKRIPADLPMREYGTWALVHDEELTSDGGFDVSNIPGTYAHLKIFLSHRTDRGDSTDTVNMRFNGDSGYNYVYYSRQEKGDWSTGGSASATGGEGVVIWSIGDNAPANRFAFHSIDIYNYAGNSAFPAGVHSGWRPIALFPADVQYLNGAFHWKNTNAINRVQFVVVGGGSNFKAGSRLTIYGINA